MSAVAVASRAQDENHILKENGFAPNVPVSPRLTSPKPAAKAVPMRYHSNLEVIQGNGKYTSKLVSVVPMKAGQVICKIDGVTMNVPKRYTSVQCGIDLHLELNSDLVYMNHSCSPTVVVDVEKMEVRGNKDIPAGGDLTFFYPSTEWDMDQPFVCWCGAPECVRMVGGSKYLSAAQLGRYFVNKHIREQLCKYLTTTHL